MADQKSAPEWLPVGWTMKVKACRNGRKFKCYIDPTCELKFHSKPEVLRYLEEAEVDTPKSQEKDTPKSQEKDTPKSQEKKAEVKNPKSQEKNDNVIKPMPQEKNKDDVKLAAKNLVVEKIKAEGLPPGWTKEERVRIKGRCIRKDMYYTDPVSGYIFRSLKDIERYLKTGELGRDAFKPKDQGRIGVELGNDKLSSHAVIQGDEVPGSGTYGRIIENHCSKSTEMVKDEEILSSTSIEDLISLTKHDSDQYSEGGTMSISTPQTKSLDLREGKSESNLDMSVSAPVVGACPEKIAENGEESHGSNRSQRRTSKSNDKRAPASSRRASKRLAGVELDPAPELKTNNRARRLTARRSSGEAENSSSENFCDLATPKELPGKLVVVPLANEKLELSIVLPLASLPKSGEQPISEEQTGEVKPQPISEKQAGEQEPLPICGVQAREEEPAIKVDLNPGSPLNLSLTDLWMDPCIEFAIKTLTGAIPVGDDEHNKADENLGSSLNLPLGELWTTDPCIEFAVKTLTGAIPVGEDLGIPNFFQQEVGSSSQGAGGNTMLPNGGNFGQTDYISQHFEQTANKQLD